MLAFPVLLEIATKVRLESYKIGVATSVSTLFCMFCPKSVKGYGIDGVCAFFLLVGGFACCCLFYSFGGWEPKSGPEGEEEECGVVELN